MKNNRNKLIKGHNEGVQFLRDFDLLTNLSQQQALLYAPAKMEVGLSMLQGTHVLTEQKTKFSLRCHIDEFKSFGPGIYLLFKLLKYLAFAFGAASLIALAAIILLVCGLNTHGSQVHDQFKSGILKTTIYNLTSKNFSVYVFLDIAITILLSAALIYWSEKEKDYTLQCLKETTLTSYSTVVLRNLPEKYNEHELKTYLSAKFGEVAQIYTVRNFGDDLLDYKDMCEIVRKYKQQKALMMIQQKRNCHKLVNLFFEFRNGHSKLKEQIKKNENYKPCFAFVQFKKIQDRQKLLQYEDNLNFTCCFKNKSSHARKEQQQRLEGKVDDRIEQKGDQFQLQAYEIKQCEMEPGGILWENLHLARSSKIVRIGVMILMMIIVMTVSVLLIILLSVMQMSVVNSKFKDFDKEQIIKTHDGFALLSYCVNLPLSEFYHQSDICSPFRTEYFKLTFMILMIPLSISIFKFILTEVMKVLISFRRYAYEIRKLQSQAAFIFAFYFSVTGIFQLFVYLGSSSVSLFNIFTPLIKLVVNSDFDTSKITLFPDYIPNWYVTASSNIIIIGAVSFNLSAIGIILYCYLRKKIFTYFATKQKIQTRMNQWLRGYKLEIEYIYAAVLTIIYFTMVFGAGMPLLYVLAFISCVILFWSYKFVFINFCERPLTYNHSINKKMRKVMFGALILHCLFSPIFLKAPGIADNLSVRDNFLQRIIHLWQYFVLLILLCLYLLLEKPIRILFPTIKQYLIKLRLKILSKGQEKAICEEKRSSSTVNRRNFTLPTLIRKRHNQLANESYSMHKSEVYKDILKTLYTINNKERTRKSCQLNPELFHLYADSIKTTDTPTPQYCEFRTLKQVIQALRKDYKIFNLKHKKSKNPYEKSKKKLYEIYENSKRGENKKYTLFLSRENAIKNMLNFEDKNQGMEKDETWSQGFSAVTKTKDILLYSNLEKVIQQPESLQMSVDSRQYNERKSNRNPTSQFKSQKKEQKQPAAKIKKFNASHDVQIPQNSDNRLNQSAI